MAPAGGVWSVLVVFVQTVGEGVAAFVLARVAARVCPVVGHGAVESLDLAVGLWAVWPRSLRSDR